MCAACDAAVVDGNLCGALYPADREFPEYGLRTVYAVQNALTANNIEVLDLYTYRIGLENMDYSYGVAISILKSIVSISLVVLANMVAKKIRGNTVI